MKTKHISSILIFIFLITTPVLAGDLKIAGQKAGLLQVNAYLIYDEESQEGAIIDPGGEIKQLLKMIQEKHIRLKFILLTHAHQDHIGGLKDLQQKFPEAKTAFGKEEWEDFKHYLNWNKIFSAELVKRWTASPQMKAMMDFNYEEVKKPDILIGKKEVLNLGESTLTALKTPGHSRGSVSYYMEGAVFTGDLILYHTAGALPYFLSSKDELVKNIRMLYKMLPDQTKIYSGHGEPSTIGMEKTDNKNVTETRVNWNL